VALADQNLRSTTESISDYGLKMATISEAEAGQGQTVSGSRAVGGLSIGSMVSDARSKANSGRWYMSPGAQRAGRQAGRHC